MHISKLFYFGTTLYIFCISVVNQPDAHLKIVLFWNNTLHISDGLSVHHQESKTVHTASGICNMLQAATEPV